MVIRITIGADLSTWWILRCQAAGFWFGSLLFDRSAGTPEASEAERLGGYGELERQTWVYKSAQMLYICTHNCTYIYIHTHTCQFISIYIYMHMHTYLFCIIIYVYQYTYVPYVRLCLHKCSISRSTHERSVMLIRKLILKDPGWATRSYECASSLVTLSSSPVAIHQAAQAWKTWDNF